MTDRILHSPFTSSKRTLETCRPIYDWTCANGECIDEDYFCDGSSEWGNASYGPDCSDGSDEVFGICCKGEHYEYTSEICPERFARTKTDSCNFDEWECANG